MTLMTLAIVTIGNKNFDALFIYDCNILRYARSLLTLSSQSTPNSDLRMCMHESPLSRPRGGRFSRRRETSRVCYDKKKKKNAKYVNR